MKTYAVLGSDTKKTFYKPVLKAAKSAGQVCLADEDLNWRSIPAEHPYRVPRCSITFEPQPQWREVVRLRPMHRWGVVLAGGDGVRMREFTQSMWGTDQPKQFCPLLGNGTLLEQTRHRAERSIAPEQILYSVTRAHERFYLPSLAGRTSRRLVQPSNKGTAPAILASLVQISRMDPNAIVAILPCDHYYFPEDGFTAALDAAFNTAEERSRSVLIMGIDAKRPEVEYGWIELGPKIGGYSGIHQVVAFHEKPALPLAEKLLRAGSLWNTFVLVGHICAFLEMAWRATPRLLQALESAEINSNCSGEIQIPDSVYERLGQTDFSREILAPSTDRLLALRLRNIEWADIGNPDRLLRAILHNQNASLAFRGPGPRAGENPVGPLKAFRAVAN